ncbi:Thaumatin-like protein, partial [Thalictrum thalictroides]
VVDTLGDYSIKALINTVDHLGSVRSSIKDSQSSTIRCPFTVWPGILTSHGGQDFYDISNVDGFNIPVSIRPDRGCRPTSCSANINSFCPPELSVRGSRGNTVGCKSACLAFNKPHYCCTGEFSSGPDKCKPTDYSRIFKNACPQAYSYAYDDASSIFTCATGANYAITFCPANSMSFLSSVVSPYEDV